MKSAQCSNGHLWAKYERWVEEPRTDRSNFRRRFCWMCKQERNKRRFTPRTEKNIHDHRINFNTPSLQKTVKPKLDVVLAGNVRYRIYPCATEGV